MGAGRRAPVLVGLRYRPGQTPVLTREWTSDAVGGGPLGSPVLSADGSTVYVNGRDERAVGAQHRGRQAEMVGRRWTIQPQTPPSVSPDGLIVAGGGPDAKLVAHQGRR